MGLFFPKDTFFNLALSRRNFPSTVMGGVAPDGWRDVPHLIWELKASLSLFWEIGMGALLSSSSALPTSTREHPSGEKEEERRNGAFIHHHPHTPPPPRSRPHLVPIRNRRIRRRGRVSHLHISARPRDRIQISKPPPKKFGQWCGCPPGEGGRQNRRGRGRNLIRVKEFFWAAALVPRLKNGGSVGRTVGRSESLHTLPPTH